MIVRCLSSKLFHKTDRYRKTDTPIRTDLMPPGQDAKPTKVIANAMTARVLCAFLFIKPCFSVVFQYAEQNTPAPHMNYNMEKRRAQEKSMCFAVLRPFRHCCRQVHAARSTGRLRDLFITDAANILAGDGSFVVRSSFSVQRAPFCMNRPFIEAPDLRQNESAIRIGRRECISMTERDKPKIADTVTAILSFSNEYHILLRCIS